VRGGGAEGSCNARRSINWLGWRQEFILEERAPEPRRWVAAPSPGRAGTSSIIQSGKYALARFNELGIPFPTPNRLQRAVEAVEELQSATDTTLDLPRFRGATRTIYDSYYIARASASAAGRIDPESRNQLARMLSGPDLVMEEDENSSRARNVQFELLLGAWFTCGGAAVRIAEPDLRVIVGGEELGIAAKRIRSRRQIRKRIHKAVAQVLRGPGRGFPALCVDALLDDLDQLGDPDVLGRQFDECFPEFDDEIARLEGEPRIYGLLAMGTRAGWVPGSTPPQLDIGSFIKFRALIRNPGEQVRFNNFWEDFRTLQATRMLTF
jgi:hypothetical protein